MRPVNSYMKTVNSYIPIVIEIPAVIECFLKYKTKPETLVEWRKRTWKKYLEEWE